MTETVDEWTLKGDVVSWGGLASYFTHSLDSLSSTPSLDDVVHHPCCLDAKGHGSNIAGYKVLQVMQSDKIR